MEKKFMNISKVSVNSLNSFNLMKEKSKLHVDKSASNLEKLSSTFSNLSKVYATGKRKTAVAKIWIATKGSGRIQINSKTIKDYFKRSAFIISIFHPLILLKVNKIYDVKCQVMGSGLSAQAEAIRHGISKALNQINQSFHDALKKDGLLTRDSRRVERKKYGQLKARKKFQFSKR